MGKVRKFTDKVIKVTDEEIFVGKEDGTIIKANKSDANWNVQVGDAVEIYTDGKMMIVKLIKGKKNSCFNKIVEKSRKLFPILFSSIFAFFLIALIVICVVPRGKKYTYNETVNGLNIYSTITFSGDRMELIANNVKITRKYYIDEGKLYSIENSMSYYEGDITSTQLISKDTYIIYKEKTMIALKVISITFMVISGLLDVACITIMILEKKGIIKIKKEEKVVESEPLNS